MKKIVKISNSIQAIIIITLIVKLFGMLRDIVIAQIFGASKISDAYIIAITIPTVLFAFYGAAISAGFIPIYSKINENEGKRKSLLFMNSVIKILSFSNLLIILVVLLFPQQVVKIFASGFDIETTVMTATILKIIIPVMLIYTIVHIVSAYLNINTNFFYSTIITLPTNILIIFFVVLSKSNYLLLSFGYLAASVVQLLILIPAYKFGFKFVWTKKVLNSDVKSFIVMSLPVLLSVGISDINKLIDKNFASNMGIGAISALSYSEAIVSAATLIVIYSISTFIYPKITKMASSLEYDNIVHLIENSIIFSIALVLPITLYTTFLSESIVELLFYRGQFGDDALYTTSQALVFYGIGMFFTGYKQILNRCFFAFKNTTIPTSNAIIALIINIALNFIFYYFTNLRIIGLTLATSISAMVTFLLMLRSFNKKIGKINYIRIVGFTIPIIFISFAFLVGVIALNEFFSTVVFYESGFITRKSVVFLISSVISAPLYIAAIFKYLKTIRIGLE